MADKKTKKKEENKKEIKKTSTKKPSKKEEVSETKVVKKATKEKISKKDKERYLRNADGGVKNNELGKLFNIILVMLIITIPIYILLSFSYNRKQVDPNSGKFQNKEILASRTYNMEGSYLVVFYDFEKADANFKNLVEQYNDIHGNLYQVNLADGLNESYIVKKEKDINTDKKDLKVKDKTMLKIKNKKLEKSYVDEEINDYLQKNMMGN